MKAEPIASIEVFPCLLPFCSTFIAGGKVLASSAEGAPHVYVKVVTQSGAVGWGEARPSPRWSDETLESVTSALHIHLAPALIGHDIFDVRGLHHVMNGRITSNGSGGQNIAKSAIDMAAHDAIGKLLDIPVEQLWGAQPLSTSQLSWTIATTDTTSATANAERGLKAGYVSFNLKINGANFSAEMDKVREVRKVIGADAHLWVDCNCSLRFKSALNISRQLSDEFDVAFIEQPLPAHDWLGHALLTAQSPAKIALDESLFNLGDVAMMIRMRAADAAVIKASKFGGLYPARVAAEMSFAAGLYLVASGLTESRLGLVASCRLFNAMGVAHPYGLNGPQFVIDDPVMNVCVEGDRVQLPQGNGLGVQIDERKLEKYRA
jgi:muconate cycloisomerase